MADPILFFFFVETFIFLGLAIVGTKVVHQVRQRWSHFSTPKMLLIVLLAGVAIDLVFEPLAISLGLFTYAAGPIHIALGEGQQFPLIELFAAGGVFGLVVAVRVFKDDQGRTLVERGLDHHTPRVRKVITQLALYSFFQLAFWSSGNLPIVISGLYQGTWPKVPAHLLNGVCDAPGVHGTRYGTCPGDPGFRMPGRHSLPGRSP